VAGRRVWKNGAKKASFGASIDLNHYESPSWNTLLEIDRLANETIFSGMHIANQVYTRTAAEGRWDFILCRGGAIAGNAIRVVDVQGIVSMVLGHKFAMAPCESSPSPATSRLNHTMRTYP
jgi:alanyl-tRNA synthetase